MPDLNSRVAVCLLLGVLGCGREDDLPSLAIVHVNVVDVARGTITGDRTVTIAGHRIVRIDSATEPSGNSTVLDGTNRYLIPGLWDMHVHLDEEGTSARQLLSWGITGVRAMGDELDPVLALRDSIRRGLVLGPSLVIAGPALRGAGSEGDSGLEVVESPESGVMAVDSLALRKVDFIKVHENLTAETFYAVARRAKEKGLTLAGHVSRDLDPVTLADSGLHTIEHFEFLPDRCLVIFDSTVQAHHGPYPTGCSQTVIASMLSRLRADSVWLDPTLGSFRIFAPRQFPHIVAGFRRLVPQIRAAGLPLLAGSDLGSAGIIPGESLHDELMLLVESGFSPAEALLTATRNPAVLLGRADSTGLVLPRFQADLVLLESNPLTDIRSTRRIVAVILGGRVLNRTSLDSLRVTRH